MSEHVLTLPIDDAQVERLEIGDSVRLTGTIFTARDMAHLEIKRLLAAGQPLPVHLAGGAVFHAGPVVRKVGDQWELIVIGPTTSIRMEPYARMVGELGIKLLIGKGGMGPDSQAMFKQYKQAYLQAAPGCAVQIAAGVRRVAACLWPQNGMPEAMWVLEVEKLGPFIVTMDARGNSRYEQVKAAGFEKVKQLYG
jgi:fumarate hydratase subunit beta/L(+)-tartrate dehydratase beta subunit